VVLRGLQTRRKGDLPASLHGAEPLEIPASSGGGARLVKTAADRQKVRRARRRNGVAVWRVAVEEYPALTALIEAGRLTEIEALDRHKAEAAAAEVFAEWCERWLKK
jgi:hypothetical protein